VPAQDHLDRRQRRGDREPAQAEGLAVLLGEPLRDEPDVLARRHQHRGDRGRGHDGGDVPLQALGFEDVVERPASAAPA
jgi:hypothetical protein